jgi:transposase
MRSSPGNASAAVLAQLARGRMRGKIRQLEEALDCSFFTGQHAFILQMMLANIDHLTAQVSELSARIEVLCEPYARQIAQLDGIPGFGIITAQDIIAETGTNMAVFPTAGHLCSWARQAPQVSQSAGKRKGKHATGTGNPYIGAALGEAAIGAGRTQTFLGVKYRRLIRHMPKKKAQGAIARGQLVIAHALMSDPDAVYEDLGTDYYERKANIRRRARNHIHGLERLGYKVTIEPLSPDPETGDLPITTAS